MEFTGKYFEDNIQAQCKTKTEYKRSRDTNQKRLLKNFAENQGYLTKFSHATTVVSRNSSGKINLAFFNMFPKF